MDKPTDRSPSQSGGTDEPDEQEQTVLFGLTTGFRMDEHGPLLTRSEAMARAECGEAAAEALSLELAILTAAGHTLQ